MEISMFCSTWLASWTREYPRCWGKGLVLWLQEGDEGFK